MNKSILFATFVVELVLVLSRALARWITSTDRYGGCEDQKCKWVLMPYDFNVDWFRSSGSNVKKGAFKPPKIRNPRSRDV